MRSDITDNCCATARRLIADGLNGDEILEFCRGDMVCLRGRADDFAKVTVREDERRGPEFVRYQPMTPEKKAALRGGRAALVR